MKEDQMTTTKNPTTAMAGSAADHTTAAAAATNAVKVYGDGDAGVLALAGVSVVLPPARFTAIMGASG
jgi:putative ABC transport system ATP-binding protein